MYRIELHSNRGVPKSNSGHLYGTRPNRALSIHADKPCLMHIGRMMQIERRQVVASEMKKVSKQVIP